MDKKLISVIIPVYNVEKYLDRCIESIVNQTYKNLEIILVDDGSPDNCPQMCDEWAEKDSRIIVVHQSNQGLIRARDTGLKNATGSFVSFVDSDDWVEDNYIEYLYNLLYLNDSDVSVIDVISIDDENVSVPDIQEETVALDFESTIKEFGHNLCYLVGKLYKANLFEGVPKLPSDVFFGEDTLRNYFVYKQCKKIMVSNQIKYYYFRHGEAGIAGPITYNLIDSSMKAYSIIEEDFDKTLYAYQYQLYNKIMADFFLLNSIIRNQLCLERYQIIRTDIINCYCKIKDKSVVSKKHLYAVKLLKAAPALYNLSIKIRTKMRGY